MAVVDERWVEYKSMIGRYPFVDWGPPELLEEDVRVLRTAVAEARASLDGEVAAMCLVMLEQALSRQRCLVRAYTEDDLAHPAPLVA